MNFRLFLLLGVAVAPFYMTHPVQAADDTPLYRPELSVGGKLGNQRDIGEVEVLIPIQQKDDALVYGDFRLRDQSGTGFENNLGVGYRQIEGDVILGGYAIGDYRETPNNNSVRQLTLGAEVMGTEQDARVNIYLPERDRKTISEDTQLIQAGTQYFFEGTETYERAAPGFDLEFGQKIPFVPFDMRVYAAGYHFFQEGGTDMTGGRVRARATTDDLELAGQDFKLQFEAEAQHDNIRDDTFFAGGRIIIPFGEKPEQPLTELQKRMTERPERDIDIVVSDSADKNRVAATASVNGQNFTEVHDVTLGAGADLSTSVASINQGALIRINTATPQLVTSAVTMKRDQALIGGGGDIVVSGGGHSATISGDGSTTDLVKATAIGDGNALINLTSRGNGTISDINMTNQNASVGDANVMIKSDPNALSQVITIQNVSSDGAVVFDQNTGYSSVTINDSSIHGGVFKTNGVSSLIVMDLTNNDFYRSFSTSAVLGNLTSSILIEAVNDANLAPTIVGNNFIDNQAPVGGRSSTGVAIASSSSSFLLATFTDNDISRTSGSWDLGAVNATYAVGGTQIALDHFMGNSGDDLVAQGSYINIGDGTSTLDAAGIAAANNGMTYTDNGDNIIINAP